MKIFQFINIVSTAFSTALLRDLEEGEKKTITDQLRYSTVLTWFTDTSAEDFNEVNKVIMKSTNFCNKLLNGNTDKDMPIKDAGYLKSKISSEGIRDVYDYVGLTEEAEENLINEFDKLGVKLPGDDIPQELTDIFFQLLNDRANINKNLSIRNAIFIGNDKVQVGKKIIQLPADLQVPNLPTQNELPYINAILQVYAQKEKRVTVSIDDLDTMSPVYKTKLQIHREDFYSAESVLHKIRDFFFDAEREFNCLKDDIYNGIKLYILHGFSNGYERMNSTLEFVMTISYRKSYLSTQGNGLIGTSEERGIVHMLVNEGKITWIKDGE